MLDVSRERDLWLLGHMPSSSSIAVKSVMKEGRSSREWI